MEKYNNKIDENIYIEELIGIVPESIQYLQKKGIRCIACGEPVWGTLKEAASLKKITNEELELIIEEINSMI